MDQRKVNVLAREYCDDLKKKIKPIILSHAMLPGLLQACYLALNASRASVFCASRTAAVLSVWVGIVRPFLVI